MPSAANLFMESLGRDLSILPTLIRRRNEAEATPARVRVVARPAPKANREKTMRFMVLVKATKDSEAGVLPDATLLSEMGKYNETLVKAGVMLAGEGLQASSKGARVKFSASKRTVVDGPFTEAKELIAGFWLIQVKSKEEAIEWVKRIPNPRNEEFEIEVRQVFEPEDFGPELNAQVPEVFEAERKFREAGKATQGRQQKKPAK